MSGGPKLDAAGAPVLLTQRLHPGGRIADAPGDGPRGFDFSPKNRGLA